MQPAASVLYGYEGRMAFSKRGRGGQSIRPRRVAASAPLSGIMSNERLPAIAGQPFDHAEGDRPDRLPSRRQVWRDLHSPASKSTIQAIYTQLARHPEITDSDMPKKEPGFAERLQTAAKAKKMQLEKSRAMASANGSDAVASNAAQVQAVAERRIRTAERKRTDRLEAQEREAQRAAEKARQAQAAIDQIALKDAERVAKVEAAAAREREQKVACRAKGPAEVSHRRSPIRAELASGTVIKRQELE
jgi:hypothetical protein